MTIFEWLVAIFLFSIYFTPTVFAVCNQNKHKWAIFALNLLLGWTGVFWIASLVWALMKQRDILNG